MNEKSANVNNKIDYVKPVILDLGAVTAAYGDSDCYNPGSSATYGCDPSGNSAGVDCVSGPGAYTCSTGTGATGT